MHRCLLIALIVCALSTVAGAEPRLLSLSAVPDHALGEHLRYFQDADTTLTPLQAAERFARGEGAQGSQPILSFGIGAAPVWMQLQVSNPSSVPITRRASVEVSWLDALQLSLVSDGQLLQNQVMGDRLPHGMRPVDGRYFSIDLQFPPGESTLVLRVATLDPMVVPLYLRDEAQRRTAARNEAYTYGFIYGYLLALMAYNALLFVGLRGPQYLYYALYLGCFVVANASYTGHAFAWLWPNAPDWQRWAQPILMSCFALSGLLFATRFLHTRQLLPRSHRYVWRLALGFSASVVGAALLDAHFIGIFTAFAFMVFFFLAMLYFGVVSVGSGNRAARYFLAAAIFAIVGVASTTLSVWGFIPFDDWTFRAVELGMLLDATLLALALSYQFRSVQEEKRRVERIAELDPLTGVANRRSFYDKVDSLWQAAIAGRGRVSMILLDVDNFKQINDTRGHGVGDAVLVAIARVLSACARKGDVVARWGGEEFIVCLADTALDDAVATAQRLRAAIAVLMLPDCGEAFTVTASFGVVERETEASLDALIATADRYLYLCKQQGKDQIRAPGFTSASPDFSAAV